MLDSRGIIMVLRLITGASYLTPLKPCYTIPKTDLSARDESQQPSRRDGSVFLCPEKHVMQLTQHDIDRFWAKVNKTDGCWEWSACRNNHGYGQFGMGRRLFYAHRISYLIANGHITGDMEVLHDCDNPACVRPDHLHQGTHQQNMIEARDRNRIDMSKVRGENNHNALLTTEQVRNIRNEYDAGGISERKLAQKYGVSRGTIRSIIKRFNWKYVE